MFKVGDKVRLKPSEKFVTICHNDILTVRDIKYQGCRCLLYFDSDRVLSGYFSDRFELASSIREDKLKALKSFDLIYIGDKLVEFVGWSKPSAENYIVYYSKEKEYTYRHAPPSLVRFVEDFWWVPLFKQGKGDEFPELGKDHYNTKKECDDKWKSHPRFIGSVRVDNEAPAIR